MNLPPPSPEARIHSERVAARVSRLLERDGWLSFADYMAEVLYAPGLGYYASGTRKFGADGDFVTAPELSRLFGRCIAHQLADIGRHVSDGDVIELGPGSGRLAADVLEELCAQAALPQRYRLLEVSPDLAERQRNELRNRVPDFFGRIDWIAAPPEQWRGAVIANEVLDAVPPQASGSSAG